MTFIDWWFVAHCNWALFVTPGCSFIYALYAGYGWGWKAAAILLYIVDNAGRAYGARR